MGDSFHHTTKDTIISINTGQVIDISSISQDLANTELAFIGRGRVYPQVAGAGITLTTGGSADTWGSWTTIIPVNTVPFDYVVLGAIVETVSHSGIYHLQGGWTAGASGDPGANDIVGEVRFKATSPLSQSITRLNLSSRPITANYRLVGRVKDDTGGDNISLSVNLRRYLKLSSSTTPYPAFPW